MIDYLTQADLAHLNERTIKAHGGTFKPPENLADEEILTALIDAIATDDFPRLADKAAAYFHGIITQQPFLEANERTALLAARTFVLLNGGTFHKKLKAVEVARRRIPAEGNGREIWLFLAVETKSRQVALAACQEFFRRNIAI